MEHKTLKFRHVKKFLLENPGTYNPHALSLGDNPEEYELDPGYWFSEATDLVQQEIIVYPGWGHLVSAHGYKLAGFELDPHQFNTWADRIQVFADVIRMEYDHPSPSIYWEYYGLASDDDLDRNSGNIVMGMELIRAWWIHQKYTLLTGLLED